MLDAALVPVLVLVSPVLPTPSSDTWLMYRCIARQKLNLGAPEDSDLDPDPDPDPDPFARTVAVSLPTAVPSLLPQAPANQDAAGVGFMHLSHITHVLAGQHSPVAQVRVF